MNGLPIVKTIAFMLVIFGALNWGMVGVFDLDVVAYLLGSNTVEAKAIYILISIAAIVMLVQV
jgi:uncharacterized protein